MSKVVDTDNFNGDYPDEKFVTLEVISYDMAAVIANDLNRRYSGDYAPRYFKVVADDYELIGGFEP